MVLGAPHCFSIIICCQQPRLILIRARFICQQSNTLFSKCLESYPLWQGWRCCWPARRSLPKTRTSLNFLPTRFTSTPLTRGIAPAQRSRSTTTSSGRASPMAKSQCRLRATGRCKPLPTDRCPVCSVRARSGPVWRCPFFTMRQGLCRSTRWGLGWLPVLRTGSGALHRITQSFAWAGRGASCSAASATTT